MLFRSRRDASEAWRPLQPLISSQSTCVAGLVVLLHVVPVSDADKMYFGDVIEKAAVALELLTKFSRSSSVMTSSAICARVSCLFQLVKVRLQATNKEPANFSHMKNLEVRVFGYKIHKSK